jgi:ubiquinone/menaquinone biosynthesis C-methylase UbiE
MSSPWPFADESFDFVFGSLVLEHIPDLGKHFQEVGRVIRSKGHLFVCELHPMKQILGLHD